jgi:glycerol kinase
MAKRAILAIDQGTTNTKALVVTEEAGIIAQAACPTAVHYPQPGWAEQSGEVIWDSVVSVIRQAMAAAADHAIAAIGLSNQRESAMLWDAATGEPLGPCILWQCRRTSARCAELRASGREAEISRKTGLGLDPLFSATKLAWLLDAVPGARARAARGELRAGTVDSWLLWKLAGVHATDLGNASRTQLLSIASGTWDTDLAQLFDVPLDVLPVVRASDALFGETTGALAGLPAGIPIHAVMGDSHAALFGHGIERPGRVKVTIGTGSSLMTLTPRSVVSTHGLSSTIAWGIGADVAYALEGNIAISGHTATFAAKLLGVADQVTLCSLAGSVSDSGGVCFVPALAGIGAPHWRDNARGMISGMSLATQPGHIARAALEAIALQIGDVFAALEADLGHALDAISVDGGGSANAVLMQLLADVLDRPVERMEHPEASALGVARMAGRTVGLDLPCAQPAARFVPAMDPASRTALVSAWREAISRASFAT